MSECPIESSSEVVVSAGSSDKKKIERELRRFSTAVRTSLDGIIIGDLNGNIIDVNEAVLRMYGSADKGDLIGKNVLDFVVESDRARALKDSMESMRTGHYRTTEYRALTKSGSEVPVEITTGFITNEQDEPIGFVDIIRNVAKRKEAEIELQMSEKKYRELTNQLPVVVYEMDLKGRFTFVNEKAFEIVGYSHDDFDRGLSIFQMVVDKDLDKLRARIQRTLCGERIDYSEYTVLRKDGSKFPALACANPIVREGEIVGLRGIVIDITERKKTEDLLKESEAKYRQLVEQSSQGIIVAVGPDPHGVFVNEAMTHIFGYTREEFYSFSPKQIAGMIHPEDRDRFFRYFKERLKGKDAPSYYEVRGIRKDGGIVWLDVSSRQIVYQGQKAVQAIFSDITERKHAEQELSRFSSAVKASLDGIITGDLNGNIWDANEAAVRMYGGEDKNELIGKNVQDLLVERDRTRAQQDAIETTQTRKGKTAEYTALTKNHTEVPIEVTTQLLLDEKGEPTGFVDIVRDLTQRKKTEREIVESEEKYRAIFEGVRDAIYVHDLKGKITSVNRAVQEYGYTQEQVIGQNILKFVPKRYWPRLIGQLSQTARGKRIEGEIEVITPAGKITAEYRSNPLIRDDRVIGVLSVLRDTTDRKKTEEALLESHQKFKALFMGNPEAVVSLSPDFRVLEINPRFQELFGYSTAEAKGRSINDMIVQPARMKEAEDLDNTAKNGYVYHNTVRKRKDGTLVPVAVSAAPMKIKGRLVGYVAMYMDISELKSAEKAITEMMQKIVLMNEKLRVVGGLTRHDVRNKLNVITGNVYLLKKRLPDNNEVLEKLAEMETAVKQVTRIFEFAKAYESLGAEELVYMNVGETIDEAVALFSDLKSAKVTNNCSGLNVLADSLLRQMFYNLIDNSLKYGQKTSRIEIRYEETSQNELRLYYEDDGAGVPKETKPDLFKEGFTTGKGTGYGLYLIKKITEVYGWTIRETGTSGKGAQFTITIPRTNQNGKENYHILQSRIPNSGR